MSWRDAPPPVFRPGPLGWLRVLWRGTAMSLFSIGAALGAWMGSAGGGWMEQHHGWRAALLVLSSNQAPAARRWTPMFQPRLASAP